jgi:hypothetical protein
MFRSGPFRKKSTVIATSSPLGSQQRWRPDSRGHLGLQSSVQTQAYDSGQQCHMRRGSRSEGGEWLVRGGFGVSGFVVDKVQIFLSAAHTLTA